MHSNPERKEDNTEEGRANKSSSTRKMGQIRKNRRFYARQDKRGEAWQEKARQNKTNEWLSEGRKGKEKRSKYWSAAAAYKDIRHLRPFPIIRIPDLCPTLLPPAFRFKPMRAVTFQARGAHHEQN